MHQSEIAEKWQLWPKVFFYPGSGVIKRKDSQSFRLRDGTAMKPFGKPMSVGLAILDFESIERAVKPTQSQRAAFDELKVISVKAEEMVRIACPGEPPLTPLARLEMVEKRLGAMLAAVRMLDPALVGFYKTLSDEQKTRFNAIGPAGRFGCQRHQQTHQ